MDEERLQRRLARAGVASRRGADALIAAGRVTVDGRVAELGQRVGAEAHIEVDGAPIAPPSGDVTWLVYKPRGLLSTVRDDRGRPTVMELVPPRAGLHPVGRLDLDSEGLLLITTDGDLTYHLTHPSHGHRKRYRVWCAEGTLDSRACAALTAGVTLDDGAARAVRARPRPGGAEIVLEDGRKRQVRRMLAAVGYRVERLLRTHVGPLNLDGLEPGGARRIGPDELARVGYDPTGSREGNPTASPRRDEG